MFVYVKTLSGLVLMENVVGLIKRSFDKEKNVWVPAQIGTVVASLSKRQYGLQHFVMNPVDYVPALVYARMICGVW